MLTEPEQRVLKTFRRFMMTPSRMLCFSGPDLERHRAGLKRLTDRDFLVAETFRGGYSLTREGFDAMKSVG
ncbi:MAG: hypothetical protein AAGG46_07140 [Planctomycetota bacterium]